MVRKIDIKTYSTAAVLLGRITDRSKPTEPCIPFVPQKPLFDLKKAEKREIVLTSPESMGVSSGLLYDFLSEIAADRSLDLQGIAVFRDGKKLCEADFGDGDRGIWHITHSLCKSITGLAVGMLIGEGKIRLEDRVVSLLEGFRLPPLAGISHKNIRVRDLLTMSSGVALNEIGTVTETNWLHAFFESSVTFDPGSKFAYNSMNSYVLSAIVKAVSGKGLCDYLRPRLFGPLGITDYYWEKCPSGIEKGGCGLYMLPDDMAKIGQLYLDDGRWNGKQLVPAAYIREATSKQSEPPASCGDFDYGYHVWVGREQDSFLLNGMLGQNVIGFRDTGILIATTAACADLFQQSSYFSILKKYFGAGKTFPSAPLEPDKKAERKLKKLCKGGLNREIRGGQPLVSPEKEKTKKSRLFLPEKIVKSSLLLPLIGRGNKLPEECAVLADRKLKFDPKYTRKFGLLPVFTQIQQNNYAKGLDGVRFGSDGKRLLITFTEKGIASTVPVGFGHAEKCVLDFGGEQYHAAVRGEFTATDEGTVLNVRITYPELSNIRLIRFRFDGNKVNVTGTELPGDDFITETAAGYIDELGENKLAALLTSKLDLTWLDSKVEEVFIQSFRAELTGKTAAKTKSKR